MAQSAKKDGSVSYMVVRPEDAELMLGILREDMQRAVLDTPGVMGIELESNPILVTKKLPANLWHGTGLLDTPMVAICSSDDRVWNVPCWSWGDMKREGKDVHLINALPEVVEAAVVR